MPSSSNRGPNPYESSQTESTHRRSDSKRPIGTLILAPLLLLVGLATIWIRISQLLSAYSFSDEVVISGSYYVTLARDVLIAGAALIGGALLPFGKAVGWWASVFHAYLRIALQGVLPTIGAIVAQLSWGVMQVPYTARLAACAVCVLILIYLQKDNVRLYFGIRTKPLVLNPAFLVVCTVLIFGFDVCMTLVR